ncbi:hemerythrin domain-containing protein [Paenibacillus sp. GYB004]|uniref:hemerythrin domain-containing protein n=1 Tax=Paenibacillus sp. GYB004 TaxID=2994393 RepID=UPI002F96742E
MSRLITDRNTQHTMVLCDPSVRFRDAVNRLEEEQGEMKAQILSIRQLVEESRKGEPGPVCARIAEMKPYVCELLARLQSHEEWEKRYVFPLLAELTGKRMGPMSVMDLEREWAMQYLKSYIEESGSIGMFSPEPKTRELLRQIEQALFILEEHLRKNEEIVFPLADQIAADMDRYYR